jgi:hypothetical protein
MATRVSTDEVLDSLEAEAVEVDLSAERHLCPSPAPVGRPGSMKKRAGGHGHVS